MRITPIQQQHHPNFYAKVKFSGDLGHVTKEMMESVEKNARDLGKSTDTINFEFGPAWNREGDSFSEQGHFYEVPPSISRWVKASILFNNEQHNFKKSYNTFANRTTHEGETWRLINILLREIKNVTNPPNLSDINDDW